MRRYYEDFGEEAEREERITAGLPGGLGVAGA